MYHLAQITDNFKICRFPLQCSLWLRFDLTFEEYHYIFCATDRENARATTGYYMIKEISKGDFKFTFASGGFDTSGYATLIVAHLFLRVAVLHLVSVSK